MSKPLSKVVLIPEAEKSRIDAGRLKGSRWISPSVKEWWINEFMLPIENFFVRYSVRPNTISLFGFGLTILGALLIAMNHLIWGGWTVILAGCFDFFDGRVARRTGQVSKSGSFLDSVLDRYMDAAVFIGLIYLFKDSWFLLVVLLANVGSMATPYVKAKIEALGLACEGGSMQRPERVLYIGLGSAFSGYLVCLTMPFLKPGESHPPYLLMAAISFVALMSNISAVQRILEAFSKLEQK